MTALIHPTRTFFLGLFLTWAASATDAPSELVLTQPNGLQVVVVRKDLPLLKLLLPGQSRSERGIEIEFPEHVTGLNQQTKNPTHLYLVTDRTTHPTTPPVWRMEGNALVYETTLAGPVRMVATARLEPDGLRYTYEFSNRSPISYQHLQAVTCVQLYSIFADTRLQRTYVHHAEGFDLLASQTPERLTMPLDQWLPCRYLVPYRWPLAAQRLERDEDGITRYHKMRKADQPLIATFSQDQQWIAATCTKETGNLWTNPERSCQHVDPAITLGAGQTQRLMLKTFLVQGSLEQLLKRVQAERAK